MSEIGILSMNKHGVEVACITGSSMCVPSRNWGSQDQKSMGKAEPVKGNQHPRNEGRLDIGGTQQAHSEL